MNQKQKLVISIVVPILILFITLALTFPRYNRFDTQYFWKTIFLSLSIALTIIMAFLYFLHREKRPKLVGNEIKKTPLKRVSVIYDTKQKQSLLTRTKEWFYRTPGSPKGFTGIFVAWGVILILLSGLLWMTDKLKLLPKDFPHSGPIGIIETMLETLVKEDKIEKQQIKTLGSSITYGSEYNRGIDALNKAHEERNSHNFVKAESHYGEAIRLFSSSLNPSAKIKLEEAKFALDTLQAQQMLEREGQR